MQRDRYFVVLHEGEWKIKHGTIHSYPYHSQREAIEAAIELALHAKFSGKLSQVLVQGEDLSFRTDWTYGKVPDPRAS